MLNVLLVISLVAAVLATVALIIGCTALAFVIGVKNSTHQVVWKEAEPLKNDDPFADEEVEIETVETDNPNKRFKKFENAELLKTETTFRDLDDPGVTSNFP